MNCFVAVLGGALVAAGLSVGAFAHEGQHKEGEEGKKVTIQGELIDTACFVTSDGDAKGDDHKECAGKCMKTGVPAGILPEGSKDASAMMYLLTNPSVLAPYAAQTIKVEGTAHEDMHAIDVNKLYVKQGNDWKEVQLNDEHHKMGQGSDASKEGHENSAEHKSGADRGDGHADHQHDKK